MAVKPSKTGEVKKRLNERIADVKNVSSLGFLFRILLGFLFGMTTCCSSILEA
jgi:hypothetical protein